MTFTCPKCGAHEFKPVSPTFNMCEGFSLYVYPANAPADVPEVRVPCAFVWPNTDDALYMQGGA